MTRTCQAVGRERQYARNLRLAAVAAEVLMIAGFLGIKLPAVRSLEPLGPDFTYVPYDFPADPVVIPDVPRPRVRPDHGLAPANHGQPEHGGAPTPDTGRAADSVGGPGGIDTVDFRFIAAEFRPRLVEAPEPEYPELARQAGIEGVVGLQFVIGVDGRVYMPEVVLASDSPMLDRAALEAIRGWRFTPARQRDRPVAVRANTSIRFKLR